MAFRLIEISHCTSGRLFIRCQLAASHECVYYLLYLPAQVHTYVCWIFIMYSNGIDSPTSKLYIHDVAMYVPGAAGYYYCQPSLKYLTFKLYSVTMDQRARNTAF